MATRTIRLGVFFATSLSLAGAQTGLAASVTFGSPEDPLGNFREGESSFLVLPISGIPIAPGFQNTFIESIQVRFGNLKHPFAEGLDVSLRAPNGTTSAVFADLSTNTILPDGPRVTDIGFDGTYTIEWGGDNLPSLQGEILRTFNEGGDTLAEGNYQPNRDGLLVQSTLLNYHLSGFKPPINGDWQIEIFDEPGNGVGSVDFITLAINELLPPFEPTVPIPPTEPGEPMLPGGEPMPEPPGPVDPTQGMDPETPMMPGTPGTPNGGSGTPGGPEVIPTPAAAVAGLALLGGLGLRRRRNG